MLIVSLLLYTIACTKGSQNQEVSNENKTFGEEDLDEKVTEIEVEEELYTEEVEDKAGEGLDTEETEDKAEEIVTYEEVEREEAIDFTLKDFDGNEISLSDFFGKKIVLAFWSVYAEDDIWKEQIPKFKAQFDEFVKLREEIDEDIVILTVVDCTDGNKLRTDAYSLIRDYDFINLIDDTEYNVCYRLYGLMLTLNLVLIDTEGYKKT